MSHQEEVEQALVSPAEWGSRLASARETLGLSQEQVAQDLNLPLDYVRSLELGSLDGLPSMVFAKGYIRAYAKLLGLADNELVCEFQEMHGEGACKDHIGSVSQVREQVKMNHPVMRITSWLFIAAIIGLSVWWWQTQDRVSFTLPNLASDTTDTLTVTEQPADEVVAQVNDDGSSQLVLPKLDDQLPEQSDTQVEETAANTQEAEPEYLSSDEIKTLQKRLDEAQPETVNEPETTNVNVEVANEQPALAIVASQDLSQARLSIDFVAECWVSIKDANGKSLFNNLRGQGQSVNVSGQAPFNILIGAADAVSRFSFNGEELDLTPHSRKNIVRINLPLAE